MYTGSANLITRVPTPALRPIEPYIRRYALLLRTLNMMHMRKKIEINIQFEREIQRIE